MSFLPTTIERPTIGVVASTDEHRSRSLYIDGEIADVSTGFSGRSYDLTKRFLDILMVLIFGIVLLIPMLVIAAMVKLTSRGPVLFWSARVGRHNRVFRMAKFRTMFVETPEVASVALSEPERHVTSFGRWLRKTSLDELPQLWNILRGEMSFVGPRPVITAEQQLLALRNANNVQTVLPGITGWAQINGRDYASLRAKVALDAYYVQMRSIRFDLKIMFETIWKVLRQEDIAH